MFARENEERVGRNIAIFAAKRRRVFSLSLSRALSLPLCSIRATRLPRAMLEIEINSSLPGVRVRVARR